MATDYDAPRKNDDEPESDSIEELTARQKDQSSEAIEEDENDDLESKEKLADTRPDGVTGRAAVVFFLGNPFKALIRKGCRGRVPRHPWQLSRHVWR